MTHHDDPHSHAADAVHEGRPVEAQYARQGRGGVRILWLLIISAGAAAILLLGMWLVSNGGFAATNANDGGQAVDAAAFSQAGPATTPAADAPAAAAGPAAAAPSASTSPAG